MCKRDRLKEPAWKDPKVVCRRRQNRNLEEEDRE